MTYKDRTFCASQTDNHTCGREMSEEEKNEVLVTGQQVSWAKFCDKKRPDLDMAKKVFNSYQYNEYKKWKK